MKGLRKMYYVPYIYPYQYPYYVNVQRYNYARRSIYRTFPNEIGHGNKLDPFRTFNGNGRVMLIDHGPKPFVININETTNNIISLFICSHFFNLFILNIFFIKFSKFTHIFKK